jgi:hypothetical protein
MSDYLYGLSLDLVLSEENAGLTHFAGCCTLAR